MKNNSSVARQVEAAKKQLDAWPDWMRKAGRFEGADVSNADRQVQAGTGKVRSKDTSSSGSKENK